MNEESVREFYRLCQQGDLEDLQTICLMNDFTKKDLEIGFCCLCSVGKMKAAQWIYDNYEINSNCYNYHPYRHALINRDYLLCRWLVNLMPDKIDIFLELAQNLRSPEIQNYLQVA